MKTALLKSVYLLFLTSLLFSSCTVQKRTYNSGYHVDWHLNLASKKSNQSKVKVAINKPFKSIAEEDQAIQSISENYPLSTIDTIPNLKPKLKVLQDQKSTESLTSSRAGSSNSSKVISVINNPNKNLKLADKITERLKKHLPKISNETKPKEEEKIIKRKGVLGFILAIAAWAIFFIAVVLAFGNGVSVLILLFLIMALLAAITSLIMGFSAISSPENTADTVFGVLGITIIILPILLALISVFL